MATSKEPPTPSHAPPAAEQTQHQKAEAAKLAEDFKPNEPAGGGHGLDAEGKPDHTLSDKQLERAANEALVSLRPQPTSADIEKVLEKLAETDPKTGQLKNKVKTAKEAGEKAIAALNELRKSP